MMGPTVKQQAVLDFIRAHIAAVGFAPTMTEIGARFGLRSTNGVSDHIRALKRKGLLRARRGSCRSWVPVEARCSGAAGMAAAVLALEVAVESVERLAAPVAAQDRDEALRGLIDARDRLIRRIDRLAGEGK